MAAIKVTLAFDRLFPPQTAVTVASYAAVFSVAPPQHAQTSFVGRMGERNMRASTSSDWLR